MVDDEFPALIEQLEVVSGQITHMTQHADAGGGGGMTFWQAAHGMATIRGDGLSDVLDQTIERGSIPSCATSGATPISARACGPASGWSLMCPGRVMACRHDPVAGLGACASHPQP